MSFGGVKNKEPSEEREREREMHVDSGRQEFRQGGKFEWRFWGSTSETIFFWVFSYMY